MKKLLGGIAISALLAAPSLAADLPARMPVKAPAPVVAVATWTGCYIGVAGGWQRDERKYDRIATGNSLVAPLSVIAAETAASTSTHRSGGIVGGTIGCNWQLAGSAFVFGIEGDGSWIGNKNSFSQNFPAITNLTPRTETLTSDSNWLATIRGRLGFAVGANALLYATGGAAFMNDKASFLLVTTAGSRFQGSDDKVLFGGVVGGGIEWKWVSNWSFKAEYLHIFWDKHTFSSTMTAFNGGAPIAGATWQTSIRHSQDIVRVGLNYQFNSPVVARY